MSKTNARPRLVSAPRAADGHRVFTITRSQVAALRAEGLSVQQIAARLQCNRYLVEKALRTPAPLAKCEAKP